MSFSGTSPDGKLVEVIEVSGAPVVSGRAVPSGVSVEADAVASAVSQFCQSKPGSPRGEEKRGPRPLGRGVMELR